MANHQSAKKRARQNVKRRARNRFVKATMRTHVKRVRTALAEGDLETAQSALPQAVRHLQRAASKGVIHRNTARRVVGRLSHAVHALATPANPKAAV